MRHSSVVLGAVAFYIYEVVAFPAAAIEYAVKAERDAEASVNIKKAVAARHVQRRVLAFNATAQYVSTHGQYKFVASNLSRCGQRGPCLATDEGMRRSWDLGLRDPCLCP